MKMFDQKLGLKYFFEFLSIVGKERKKKVQFLLIEEKKKKNSIH